MRNHLLPCFLSLLVCAGDVNSVAISADGTTCVSGSNDETVRCACAYVTQALAMGVT